MKKLIALCFLLSSVNAQTPQASTNAPLLQVGAMSTAGCQNLQAVMPFAKSCVPHITLLAYSMRPGDAVRFDVSYVETVSGTMKTATLTRDVDVMGTALWIFNVGVDFHTLSATATLLQKSGSVTKEIETP